MICCSVHSVACIIRCHSSLTNSTTYTPCAAIRPRYSGSCSQRELKISAGSGFRRGGRTSVMRHDEGKRIVESSDGGRSCQALRARVGGGGTARHRIAMLRRSAFLPDIQVLERKQRRGPRDI